MQTLEENIVTIKLCNEYGMSTYLDPSTISDLNRLIPVTIIMNGSEEQIQVDHNGEYDYKDYKEFKDEDGLKINAQGTFNKTIFKSSYDVDECDHSNIEFKVYPQIDGKYYIHVLIGN